MSEGTVVVDVKVSSSVLNEDIPNNINDSGHSNGVLVEEKINSVNDECSDQKERKLWDEKAIGSNELDGRHLRRHSASLLFGANRKAAGGVPSRYRGGSIGSCHDMCKFGHKSTSEVKPKSYMKRTPLSCNESDGKGLTKVACSDNRKRSVVRHLSFPEAKEEKESQMHVGEATHSGKSTPKAKEKTSAAESPDIVKEQEVDCLGRDEEKSRESSSRDDRKIKVAKDEEKPTGLVSATLRSKKPVKKAVSMKNIVHRDPSSSSHLKNHPTRQKQEEKVKLHEDMPEKTLYMIEPNSKSTTAQTSQKAPLHGKKLPKTQGESYVGTREGSKATQNGSDDSHFAKSLLPPLNKSFKSKNDKWEDTESVVKPTVTFHGYRKSKSSTKEAISYTPKLRPGAPKAKQNGRRDSHLIKSLFPEVDEPSPSQEEELLAGTESVLGEHGDTMSRNTETKPRAPKATPGTPRSKPGTPKAKPDVEPKSKATRGPKSKSGEGEGLGSVWKMKFRRGKVISLPSGNNSPVKLKFRKHRGFSDSRHAENVGNANYKNKEVDGEDSQRDGAEPAKVVLRRHEATHKKDDVDLNNVIEETASKLVKTRKSKVKALVGAFETVMSLRDRKASETTVTS